MTKISLVFTFFLIFYQIIFSQYSISKIAQSLFLNVTDAPKFPVIAGSYWFIPVYLSSVMLTYIIYNFFKWFRWPFILLSLAYYLLVYTGRYNFDCKILLSSLRYCLFYTSLIILGVELTKVKTKQIIIALLTCLVVIVIFKFYKVNLQDSKFPVNLPYIICSLPSCFVVLTLYKYVHNLYNPIVNYIGKNSIFFYLTQGIGGSILFNILPYMTFSNIYIKYLLCLSINMVTTLILGFFYCRIYKWTRERLKL